MERKNKNDETRELSPIIWIIIAAVLMIIGAATCCAQKQQAIIDTVQCKPECIVKYVTSQTKAGNTTYRAVYIDKDVDVQEIIPVSKSVYQYISDCKTNGIKPSLGIKLKNGEISSIIRLKTKYRRIRK